LTCNQTTTTAQTHGAIEYAILFGAIGGVVAHAGKYVYESWEASVARKEEEARRKVGS
jgi:hypothetical protein